MGRPAGGAPQFISKEHPVKENINSYLAILATLLVHDVKDTDPSSSRLWSLLLETRELLTLKALVRTLPGTFAASSAVQYEDRSRIRRSCAFSNPLLPPIFLIILRPTM